MNSLTIPATLFRTETAPKRYKPRRKCQGPGPTHYVSMYTRRQNSEEPRGRKNAGKLLCNACVEKEADRLLEEARREAERKRAYASGMEGHEVPGLFAARRKRGKTQAQLAMSVGISPQHLSSIERGVAKTSKTTLRRMSQVLKVPMADLLAKRRDCGEVGAGAGCRDKGA